MSENTNIEWCDATWNPIRARDKRTGKVGHYCELVSSGCAHCYSSEGQRRFGLPKFPGAGKRTELPVVDGNVCVSDDLEVFLDEKVLRQPLKWRKPHRIFVCSMTDLFGEWVQVSWMRRIFEVIVATRQHTYQILTKRPENINRMLGPRGINFYAFDGPVPYPQPNVWLGVSVENQETADKRIPLLLEAPAAVRFLSCKPLLGAIDLSRWIDASKFWVIVGGESGPNARPCDLAWIYSLVQECNAAGAPCFVKQVGRRPYIDRSPEPAASIARKHGVGPLVAEFLKLRDPKGGNPEEWPEGLRVRQWPVTEEQP